MNILVGGEWCGSRSIDEFIRGEGEIEKLPFKPKIAEWYYSIDNYNNAWSYKWADTTADYTRLIIGLVFRTREEAEAHIPTWKERISKL